MVQLFDSWAHHLSPEQFAEFSLPYSERIIAAVRARYPHVPLIFHANGAGGKHALLAQSSAGARGCGGLAGPFARGAESLRLQCCRVHGRSAALSPHPFRRAFAAPTRLLPGPQPRPPAHASTQT